MKFPYLLLLIISSSCFLSRNFIKREFVLNNQASIPVIIPAGYTKEEIKYDSAGNKEQVYHYSNGAFFYISSTGKRINPNQYINDEMNVPREHPKGGLIYKGVLPGPLFWREIRIDSFRIGYRNVPRDWEIRFDSASNYISNQPLNRF